jgi:hypothetical protein
MDNRAWARNTTSNRRFLLQTTSPVKGLPARLHRRCRSPPKEAPVVGEEVVEGTVEGLEDAGSPKGEEEGKRSFHGYARSVTSRRERKRCTIAKRATGR